jgi:pimeloyl-ACP methyl ester carboxylesterase
MSSAARRQPLKETIVPFTAGDGFGCNLIHLESERTPHRGPVILVHGAGVRGNIFRAPVQTTIVDALIDHGYDVWLENWRASIDLPPNPWTLDQAAVFDHPVAVRTVVARTGSPEVKAVIHCQGSTSFMMSVVAGLLPEVTTIVSSSVSLHPVVPNFSRVKLKMAVPIVHRFLEYLNPQWGLDAPTIPARLLALGVAITHHECQNSVCKNVSFTYGSGFPALWRHENLDDGTHEWLRREFAHVPLSFFRQMAKCVDRGNLVAVGDRRELPEDFVARPPQTDARICFITGAKNRCFLPASQSRSYEYFERYRPDAHRLHVFPDYGHLDVYMGRNAATDVFPAILAHLDGRAAA